MIDFSKRYQALAHAVQSGVSYLMQHEPQMAEAKHLRVGIDLRAVEFGALAKLLVEKGVITQAEFEAAVVIGLEEEVKRSEQRLSEIYGSKITLA